jgi:hypothetical protein
MALPPNFNLAIILHMLCFLFHLTSFVVLFLFMFILKPIKRLLCQAYLSIRMAIASNTSIIDEPDFNTIHTGSLTAFETSSLAEEMEETTKKFIETFSGLIGGYYYITMVLAAMIILIVDTELMIYRNAKLVEAGENQWTFGQTLAMILLFFPLSELVNTIRETFPRKSKAGNHQDEEIMSGMEGGSLNYQEIHVEAV